MDFKLHNCWLDGRTMETLQTYNEWIFVLRGMSDVQDLLKLLSKYQPAKFKEVPSAYNHTTGLSKQVNIFDLA